MANTSVIYDLLTKFLAKPSKNCNARTQWSKQISSSKHFFKMLNDLVHDIDNTTRIEDQEIESRPLRLTRTKKLDGNLKRTRNQTKNHFRITGYDTNHHHHTKSLRSVYSAHDQLWCRNVESFVKIKSH